MSWDEMKRAREEEFFHREEEAKKERLRAKMDDARSLENAAKEQIEAFVRGQSPLTGAAMFKATVTGLTVLDCPEEETLLMSYDALRSVLDAALAQDTATLSHWRHFITPHPKKAP